MSNKAGRSNGRKVAYANGSRSKRLYRPLTKIETLPKEYQEGTIEQVRYDGYRTAKIMAWNVRGYRNWLLAPQGVQAGDKLTSHGNKHTEGSIATLETVTPGTNVYNIKGKMARAAGTYGVVLLVNHPIGSTTVKYNGRVWVFPNETIVQIGSASLKNDRIPRNAGTMRRLGRHPQVSGNRMNAVDHPNGGSGKGRPCRNRWGLILASPRKVTKDERQ